MILEAKSRNIAALIIQPANRHRLESEAVEYTWDPYFKAQRVIASHFQIPIIDVAPTLRAFGLSQTQSFLDNMHPTSEANFWIAQRITDEWKQTQEPSQDWLPKTNTPQISGAQINGLPCLPTIVIHYPKQDPV